MAPGLFNQSAFLTAILQTAAEAEVLELDKLDIRTDVLKRMPNDIDAPSREGNYIYGLFLEGARWDSSAACVKESKPKELYYAMPVINCKAVLMDGENDKVRPQIFDCPVYVTKNRRDYVFTANLKTKEASGKWILAGCALLLEMP